MTIVSVILTASAIEATGSVVSSGVVSVVVSAEMVASLRMGIADSGPSTGGVVFSSVARPLSFWRMGLMELVGEIESVGCPLL